MIGRSNRLVDGFEYVKPDFGVLVRIPSIGDVARAMGWMKKMPSTPDLLAVTDPLRNLPLS